MHQQYLYSSWWEIQDSFFDFFDNEEHFIIPSTF